VRLRPVGVVHWQGYVEQTISKASRLVVGLAKPDPDRA
jgi:hypothetical protein